jgi:catechol 2,3-dioxygenase-like lactoylglutathione lyase family enzyme
MDMLLELVMVPVTDVDRAKAFYEKVGFVVDHDHEVSADVRFVQLTPPGSACSIAIGKGLTKLEPGSLDNLQAVVADADAVRAHLADRGITVSEVEELQWGRFVFLADPDGNRWAFQQLPDWSGGSSLDR